MSDKRKELLLRKKELLLKRRELLTSKIQPAPEDNREFIPDAQEEARFAPTTGESLAGGVVQGLTSNFADEIAGEDAAQALKTAEEVNPKASLAGNVVGGIAQGIALPGKRILDAATTAADFAGEAEGGFVDKAVAGGKGAVLGLVLGQAGKAGRKLLANKATRKAITKAGKKSDDVVKLAQKTFGLDKRAAQNAMTKGRNKSLGAKESLINTKKLMDMGVLRNGTKSDRVLATAQELLDERVAKLDSLYDGTMAGRQTFANPDKVMDKLIDMADEIGAFKTDSVGNAAEEVITRIQNDLQQNVGPQGIDIGEIRRLRNAYGEEAFKGSGDALQKRNLQKVYHSLNEIIADSVDDPAIAKELKRLNSETSTIIKSLPGIEKKVQADMAKNPGAINRAIAGGIGGSIGSTFGGIGAGVGAAAGATLGAPILEEVTQRVASRKANKILKAAGNTDDILKRAIKRGGKYAQIMSNAAQRGVESVAAQHHVLMKTDPEYRKFNDKENEKEK